MKVERSFSFAFKAPQAVSKLLVGGILSTLFFTVFFAFVVAGYVMRVLCDALEGRDARLPDWSDLKNLFLEGMEPVLVLLGYYSPVLVLLLLQMYLSFYGGDFSGTDSASGLLLALTAALQILVSMLVPAALIRLVVKGDIKSAFNFGEMFAFIGNNAGRYFVALGISLIIVSVFCLLFFISLGVVIYSTLLTQEEVLVFVVFIASSLTFIASVLAFIGFVISAHLYAQVYRTSKPFRDDPQGAIRGSMAIPPPLRD